MASLSPKLARAALLWAVLGGCGDSDIGYCDSGKREVLRSDGAITRLGFTARGVLGWAEQTHHLAGEWTEPPPDLSWSPAAGEAMVEVGLLRREGKAALVSGCTGEAIVIPVTAYLRTADGALHEALAAELVATEEEAAELRIETRFDALKGTLEVGSSEQDLELVQPYLEAQLAPCGWQGVFTAIRQLRTKDAVSDLPMPPMLAFAAPEGCNVDAAQ